uniref:ARAD1D26598p n=1 Tax=Blastobotrys adeninivorans TaxID=409370 RepID=A0A060TAU8_BLAAD
MAEPRAPSWDTVKAAVDACKESPQSTQLLMECSQLLYQYVMLSDPKPDHWFCNEVREFAVASTRLLVSYSFAKIKDTFRDRLVQVISSCAGCRQGYYIHLAKLAPILSVAGLPNPKVEGFLDQVRVMDTNRLTEHLKNLPFSGDPSQEEVQRAFEPLHECLCSDLLQGGREDLMSCFTQAVIRYDSLGEGSSLQVPEVLPGMIFLLFGSQPTLHQWARRNLGAITTELKHLSPAGANALRLVLSQYGPPKDDIRFWYNLSVLIRLFSSQALESLTSPSGPSGALRDDSVNLAKLTGQRVVLLPSNSLHGVLKVLALLLNKQGAKFFDHSGLPPRNLTNSIVDNPYLTKNFSYTGQVDSQYDPEYNYEHSDLFNWTSELFTAAKDSDNGNSLQNVGEVLGRSLFQLSSHPTVADISQQYKDELLRIAIDALSNSFSYNLSSSLPLLDTQSRVSRGDVKTLSSTKAGIIIDALSSSNQALASSALRLVSLSIEFDIVSALPDSPALSPEITDPVVLAEVSSKHSITIWETLNGFPRIYNGIITKTILQHMKYAAFISQPPLKRVQNPLYPKRYLSEKALGDSRACLDIISDLEPTVLREALQDRTALCSLFLNMFAVDEHQRRATVDILCQAYESDAVNRLNAIHALLKHQLVLALNAFADAVETVTSIRLLSPCSNLFRVAQDLATCLYDPRDGLLNSRSIDEFEFSSGQENELLRLWRVGWSFLKFTFSQSFGWAQKFTQDYMIEFMRDELDLCTKFLEIFRLLEAQLPANIEANSSSGDLLARVSLDATDSMCSLLRLKSESLVEMNFSNIMKIVEIIKSFKIELPQKVIDLFTNQASAKAVVLNRKQRAALLAATGSFSNDRIDEILAQAESKAPTPAAAQPTAPASKTSAAAPKPASSTNNTPALSNQIKQRKISDFLRVTSEPPAPPPPRPEEAPRLTKMDEVRAQLAESRSLSTMMSASKPIPREVHPARPSGFNKRAPATSGSAQQPATATANSSDEGSDEDEDDDDGLFTEKRERAAELLRQANAKASALKIVGPDYRPPGRQINEKQREERNMRQRLNIDMGPLYEKILRWHYHSRSDYPDQSRDYAKVADTFKTVAEYQKVLEPLLMLECWQAIQKAKEEYSMSESPFTLTIGSRVTVDSFIELYTYADSKAMSDLKLSDSDLIVLTFFVNESGRDRTPQRPQAPTFPHAPDPIFSCLAKVREVKPSPNAAFTDVTIRLRPPSNFLAHLNPKATLHALRVMSMTTIEREYSSVRGLAYYDLGNSVLRGTPTPPPVLPQDKIQEAERAFDVNTSQARAILGTVSSRGVSLIQGPPGTGKTKTILGIVGAYLTRQMQSTQPRRILICAPSNAAVDELVIRLKDGVYGNNGKLLKPPVVRLGRTDAISEHVKELTLEDLVDKALADLEQNNLSKIGSGNGRLREEQTKSVERRNELRAKLQNSTNLNAEEYNELDGEVRVLNKKIKELGHKLDLQREQIQSAVRSRDIERKRVQNEILQGAQVICATLSGSAHSVLSSLQMRFETVIIDEAAQAIELSTLIPLRYGCKQAIMVGDPKQLPPTVLSQAAANLKYEQSLFVRMFNRFPSSVYMLNTQFRMHPAISQFPNREFYKGMLKDGPGMAKKTARAWHSKNLLGPYCFFDVHGTHQKSQQTNSLFNKSEAEIAADLFSQLSKTVNDSSSLLGNVAVISPYKRQVQELRRVFIRRFGELITKEVDFNSIDGFQGQEKDVIILSCVRAQEDAHGVGFLADTRRMNVALTRARSSLWILGHGPSLWVNPVWSRVVKDAKARNNYLRVVPGELDDPSFLQKAERILVTRHTPIDTPRDESDLDGETKVAPTRSGLGNGASTPKNGSSKAGMENNSLAKRIADSSDDASNQRVEGPSNSLDSGLRIPSKPSSNSKDLSSRLSPGLRKPPRPVANPLRPPPGHEKRLPAGPRIPPPAYEKQLPTGPRNPSPPSKKRALDDSDRHYRPSFDRSKKRAIDDRDRHYRPGSRR